MDNKLWIPYMYSVMREMKRFHTSRAEAVIRVIGAMVYSYLWIPIIAITYLDAWTDWVVYAAIVLHVMVFALVYEAGYLLSDLLGVKFEKKNLRRQIYRYQVNYADVLKAVGVRFAIVAVMGFLFPTIFSRVDEMLFLTTLAIFAIHSLVVEKYRLATFAGLRLMKGFVPYFFLFGQIPPSELVIIYVGLMGIVMFDLIEYGSRKLSARTIPDFYAEKNAIIRLLLVAAVIFMATIALRLSFFPSLVLFGIIVGNQMIFSFLVYIKRRILYE